MSIMFLSQFMCDRLKNKKIINKIVGVAYEIREF